MAITLARGVPVATAGDPPAVGTRLPSFTLTLPDLADAGAGEFAGRKNGSMIAMSTEKSVAYALDTLQQRGRLYVGPGEDCYEGMIVGESAKEGDMVVNVAKSKQLGNQRSSGADKAIQLTPPITFTLEEALEYIEDDDLVEVTP